MQSSPSKKKERQDGTRNTLDNMRHSKLKAKTYTKVNIDGDNEHIRLFQIPGKNRKTGRDETYHRVYIRDMKEVPKLQAQMPIKNQLNIAL
jgi:hypothetical protein